MRTRRVRVRKGARHRAALCEAPFWQATPYDGPRRCVEPFASRALRARAANSEARGSAGQAPDPPNAAFVDTRKSTKDLTHAKRIFVIEQMPVNVHGGRVP